MTMNVAGGKGHKPLNTVVRTIRRRCIADVYNNEDEIKHRCQRMAKEDSRHCWQHEPRSFRGVVRRR
jgi:hypothetical protein